MNILMLTESNFPLDIRIRQEANTLIQNGHHVSVIAIKEKDQLFFESKNGINIYRVPKIEIFKYGKQATSTKLTFISKRLKLLKAIVGYGFEIGVHGLKHDGKLFKSKKIFNKRAERINYYLKE